MSFPDIYGKIVTFYLSVRSTMIWSLLNSYIISGLAPVPQIFCHNQAPLPVLSHSNLTPLPVFSALNPAPLPAQRGHNQAPL